MKNLLCIAIALLILSCGDKPEKKKFEYSPNTTKTVEKTTEVKTKENTSFESIVDLDNKGIGPIKNIELDNTIDIPLAKKGENLFKINCMACHKIDRKFIGPALGDITAKRSPEWIMNMTMNTSQMIKEDPLAKGIFEEYDKIPMVTAPINEANARAVLEYLRTLDK
ncbi:cytochrome c [Formosa sp. PL04]|uniref:c-type cytochrome n=1 Tax=Formosa sp. PL04 TaxID=3081755 RepID=UPI002982796E|nr:cytochrome c [Formosa sp. PL04]MDW5290400.1 cytochrome c [Formosa sp. PL04]